MPATYVLEIVCPHCGTTTQVSDWPCTETAPIAFTCLAQHGGCGGHAYGALPEVGDVQRGHVESITLMPMTAAAHWQATVGGIPPEYLRW